MGRSNISDQERWAGGRGRGLTSNSEANLIFDQIFFQYNLDVYVQHACA